jgi:hypothetical protein
VAQNGALNFLKTSYFVHQGRSVDGGSSYSGKRQKGSRNRIGTVEGMEGEQGPGGSPGMPSPFGQSSPAGSSPFGASYSPGQSVS